MTEEEARSVMRICNGADGGCSHCANELRESLVRRFPEHADAFQEEFDKEWDWSYDE